MTDEHFGIGVVEMMTSGVFTIAHNSAGPKMDIIGGEGDQTGGLATEASEYADWIQQALNNFSSSSISLMRTNGRKKAIKFGDERFIKEFMEFLFPIDKKT